MSLFDIRRAVRTFGREPLVTLLGLAATVLAVVFAASTVRPAYEARGSLVLLLPATTVGPDGHDVAINPYASFGSAHGITARAIVSVSESQTTAAELRSLGVVDDYSVSVDPLGGGAILILRVEADTPEAALAQLDILAMSTREILEDQQRAAGAAEATWLRAELLTMPTEAAPLYGSRMRAVASVALLGLAGTLVGASGADVLRDRFAPRLTAADMRRGTDWIVAGPRRRLRYARSRVDGAPTRQGAA
jgi:hypothetical protein